MVSDFNDDYLIHTLRYPAKLHSDAIGANDIIESDCLEDVELSKDFPLKDGNGNVHIKE